MKNDVTESINFQLGLSSSITPQKKNISLGMQTQPSWRFDIGQQSQGLLRLDSIQKFPSLQLPVVTNTPNNFSPTSTESCSQKLQILQNLQRWVSESFFIHNERKYRIHNNIQLIEGIQHKNRLMKDQILHLKHMAQYYMQKYKTTKKKNKLKTQAEQREISKKINQYWQKVDDLQSQIKELQAKLSIKRVKKKKTKILNHERIERDRQNFYGYNPYYPPPYYSAPSLPSFGNIIYSENPQTKRSSQITFHKQNSLQRFQTPNFVSKKNSVNQGTNPLNNGIVLNTLVGHLQDVISPDGTKRDKGKISVIAKREKPKQMNLIRVSGGKWENSEEEKDVLQILQNSHKIKNRMHIRSSDQSGGCTPTFTLDTPKLGTPKFQMRKPEILHNFSSTHEKIIEERSNASLERGEKSTSGKRKLESKRGSQEESKIRIDVEQSLSSISKFSIDKRRRATVQTIKQSRINIEMLQEESKSGEASVQEQNKSARQRSPVIIGKASANSSFEKILIQEGSASQILLKCPVPPLLVPTSNKKLRKVTEQQSDLFDSSGYPRNHTKDKPSGDKFSIKDVVLDRQNLAISVGVSQMNTQIYNSPREKSLSNAYPDLPELTQVRLIQRKKITEEQQDDEDFLNVNLLAVSKISKQKQLSERDLKSIDYDRNDLDTSNSGKLYKSSMGKQSGLKKSQMPVVAEENDFYQQDCQKRNAELTKKRKVSGSRFSILNEPNFKQDNRQA